MAVRKVLVDGKQTLIQQEIALNYLEQSSFAKVTAYAKSSGNVPPDCANEAVLEDVPIGEQPPHLHLADANGAAGAKAFEGVAFVESAEKLILGFR